MISHLPPRQPLLKLPRPNINRRHNLGLILCPHPCIHRSLLYPSSMVPRRRPQPNNSGIRRILLLHKLHRARQNPSGSIESVPGNFNSQIGSTDFKEHFSCGGKEAPVMEPAFPFPHTRLPLPSAQRKGGRVCGDTSPPFRHIGLLHANRYIIFVFLCSLRCCRRTASAALSCLALNSRPHFTRRSP